MAGEAEWTLASEVTLEDSGASVANAGFIDANATTLSSANHSNYPLADFALKTVGDLSELVRTDRGFVILKLTERRPAVSRSFDEAKLDVQKRLLEERRATRRKELADEMRKTIRVEIFEDELAKLALGTPAPTPVGLDAGPVVGNRP